MLEYLDIIQKSALSAAHTVKRLQDFARKREDRPLGWADRERRHPRRRQNDQSPMAERGRGHGELPFEMALRPNAAHSVVNGEETELQEILINLIINSIDAMPEGGRITISSEDTPEGPRVSVQDTGTGMPPGVRERAFEPFFSTKGEEGTGMGLSMVFGIVIALRRRHRYRKRGKTPEPPSVLSCPPPKPGRDSPRMMIMPPPRRLRANPARRRRGEYGTNPPGATRRSGLLLSISPAPGAKPSRFPPAPPSTLSSPISASPTFRGPKWPSESKPSPGTSR